MGSGPGRGTSAKYERLKFGGQQRERRGRWVECQICGRDFYVTPARIKAVEAKGYHIRFCSKACYGKGKAGEGNPFWGRKHTEATKTRFKEHLKEHPTRPRFRADATNPNEARFGAAFRGATRSWFRDYLRRTQGRCNRCGYNEVPQVLEVHHRDRDRKNNVEANLELLCPTCHSVDHWRAKDGGFGGYPAREWPDGWAPWLGKPQEPEQ